MKVYILLLCVCLCFVIGCSEPPSGEVVVDHIAEGWSLFAEGDYQAAVDEFETGISADAYEAYNGLGWSYAKLDRLSDARDSFESAHDADTAEVDPYAGLAPVYRDLEPPRFDDAIATAQEALERESHYTFEHYGSFDWCDLKIIMAQSYYNIGLLEAACGVVDELGGTSPDPDSPTFGAELAKEIERLEREYGD